MTAATYVYSVVRATPRPRRDETVNLGIVVIATDGTFSDAKFGSLDRVRKLYPEADLRSVELFLEGITERLPLQGVQARLHLAEETVLSSDVLTEWSREFAGAVRISEPRAALAVDAKRLVDSLFEEFVGTKRSAMEPRAPRRVMRPDILDVIDRAVLAWNVAEEAVEPNSVVFGKRARHVIDRAYLGSHRSLVAVAHAISFQAKDLSEILAQRATVIVASEDLHEREETSGLPVFAVHSDAPAERLDALEESALLFNTRGVTPVALSDLTPVRNAVDVLLAHQR